VLEHRNEAAESTADAMAWPAQACKVVQACLRRTSGTTVSKLTHNLTLSPFTEGQYPYAAFPHPKVYPFLTLLLIAPGKLQSAQSRLPTGQLLT
jgi:hypothetical protein